MNPAPDGEGNRKIEIGQHQAECRMAAECEPDHRPPRGRLQKTETTPPGRREVRH